MTLRERYASAVFGESVIIMETNVWMFPLGRYDWSRAVSHFDDFNSQMPRTLAPGLHPESRVNGSGAGAAFKNLHVTTSAAKRYLYDIQLHHAVDRPQFAQGPTRL